MKNFKQTIPAIILGLLVVGAVSFADIKTQISSNCTPPACNPTDDPVYTVSDQNKTGGFTAGYIGSTGVIDARDTFIVGKQVVAQTPSGGLRVVNGFSLFKDAMYIGNSISITDNLTTTPPTTDYTLTLKPGSTTNIGMGDYCIKTASQVTSGSIGCSAGSFVTFYNPSAPSGNRGLRCTEINPSSVNNNTGGNKGTCASFTVTLTRSYDGTNPDGICQYTASVSGGTYPANVKISRNVNWTGYGLTPLYSDNFSSATNYGGGSTFGTTMPGAGSWRCDNTGGITYRATVTDANGEIFQTPWVK